MNISFYYGVTDKTGIIIDIAIIFNDIKSEKNNDQIMPIRRAETKQERTKLKLGLPGFTISGTFNGARTDDNIISHSGLIQIDIDDDLTAIKNKDKIFNDKFTYCGFISPSGTGLKLIVKIPPDIAKHKEYFNAVCNHYDSTYNKKTDRSISNISRLCFISSDPELYLNENSEVFTEYKKPEGKIVIKSLMNAKAGLIDHLAPV